MEITDKEIIRDLEEDNRLLSSKIEMYKEELKVLKDKLEYAQKLFTLYESIMECSKTEIKDLNEEIKRLKGCGDSGEGLE